MGIVGDDPWTSFLVTQCFNAFTWQLKSITSQFIWDKRLLSYFCCLLLQSPTLIFLSSWFFLSERPRLLLRLKLSSYLILHKLLVNMLQKCSQFETSSSHWCVICWESRKSHSHLFLHYPVAWSCGDTYFELLVRIGFAEFHGRIFANYVSRVWLEGGY